ALLLQQPGDAPETLTPARVRGCTNRLDRSGGRSRPVRYQEVVAHLAGPLERLGCADRGHPDGRVRLLLRSRVDRDVLPVVEAPLERDVLLRPQAHTGGDALFVAGTTVFGGHAEGLELVGQEGPREAGVQAAAGDAVQHRQLAGVLQRVD